MFSPHLSNLEMWKDESKGTISIRVRADKELTCPGCRFLIRLFDEHGQYLTHFTSEPFYKLFRTGEGIDWKVPDPIELTYSVDARDLKFVKQAEFGVIAF